MGAQKQQGLFYDCTVLPSIVAENYFRVAVIFR